MPSQINYASDVLTRFLRYCKVASPSNELTQDTVPSTPTQHTMAQLLYQELLDLGAQDVSIDEHAYVTAHWPASPGSENKPTLGFCCHVDTVWLTQNDEVHPQVLTYTGVPLTIGQDVNGNNVTLSAATNPELNNMIDEELVCADGTSLLGGDDKAGIAEIMALLARLKENPQLAHPRLAIAFVPDEEIGHGAALLDLKTFGASYGYTIDAGPLGEFCYETFNAAQAEVYARGFSVHTGTAKGKMIHAAEALIKFNNLLPAQERPEYTRGYDGFYYLERIKGDCENAHATYIMRDHNYETLEKRKRLMEAAVSLLNIQYGQEVLTVKIHDQYHNLADVVGKPKYAHLIENARTAYLSQGVQMYSIPMRGGTDGSQLSFRGFPCANLSACYYNAHGPKEFVPVHELEAMVDVLQELVRLYA